MARGETLGLVGESGSGKTTLGRCLLRLAEPTSGQILFHGQDITEISRRDLRNLRSRIQIVFQEPYDAVDPRLTIGEIISEPLRMTDKLSVAERTRRLDEVSEQVYIEPSDLGRYPHELSSGELQRVGIARAMVTRPELIVLDEPTSLLDPSIRADIVDLLISLQRTLGVSYVFISHDLTTVRHISHRIAVMYLGKVVESAAVERLFEKPSHPYTKALLSSVLFPDPNRKRADYPLRGEIPSPVNLPTGCFLHSRCPLAISACSRIEPQLVGIGGGHEVACIRVAPLADQLVEEGQFVGTG